MARDGFVPWVWQRVLRVLASAPRRSADRARGRPAARLRIAVHLAAPSRATGSEGSHAQNPSHPEHAQRGAPARVAASADPEVPVAPRSPHRFARKPACCGCAFGSCSSRRGAVAVRSRDRGRRPRERGAARALRRARATAEDIVAVSLARARWLAARGQWQRGEALLEREALRWPQDSRPRSALDRARLWRKRALQRADSACSSASASCASSRESERAFDHVGVLENQANPR